MPQNELENSTHTRFSTGHNPPLYIFLHGVWRSSLRESASVMPKLILAKCLMRNRIRNVGPAVVCPDTGTADGGA